MAPSTSGSNNGLNVNTACLYNAQSIYANTFFPVAMRTYPTGSYSALSDFSILSNGSSGGATLSTLNPINGLVSSTTSEVYATGSASFTSGYAAMFRIVNTTGWMAFSAEL
jgi:hypothetical protein